MEIFENDVADHALIVFMLCPEQVSKAILNSPVICINEIRLHFTYAQLKKMRNILHVALLITAGAYSIIS